MKKFSIITINYNNLVGLKKTIKSVSDQEFNDYEYVIIDGFSNDGSAEYIKNNKDIVDKYLIEKDKGIYDALNKGIEICDGEYILALNSGDELIDKDVLAKVAEKINNLNNPVGVIFGKAMYKYDGESFDWTWPSIEKNQNIDIESWLKEYNPNHQTSFIHKNIYKSYKYNTNYNYFGDSDFWYRLKSDNIRFIYITLMVSNFELGGLSNYSTCIKDVSIKSKESFILSYFYKNKSFYNNLLLLYIKYFLKFIYNKLMGKEKYFKRLRSLNKNNHKKFIKKEY